MNREQAQATFTQQEKNLRNAVARYRATHTRQDVSFDDLYQAAAEAAFAFLLKWERDEAPFFPKATVNGAMYRECIKAYPMKVPRNVFSAYARSENAPRFCREDMSEWQSDADSPENEWLAEDSIAAVIQSLPELERMIVALHSEGLTYGEIADTLRPFISRDASAICRLFQRARRIALEELAR